jgi:hypothetical protein
MTGARMARGRMRFAATAARDPFSYRGLSLISCLAFGVHSTGRDRRDTHIPSNDPMQRGTERKSRNNPMQRGPGKSLGTTPCKGGRSEVSEQPHAKEDGAKFRNNPMQRRTERSFGTTPCKGAGGWASAQMLKLTTCSPGGTPPRSGPPRNLEINPMQSVVVRMEGRQSAGLGQIGLRSAAKAQEGRGFRGRIGLRPGRAGPRHRSFGQSRPNIRTNWPPEATEAWGQPTIIALRLVARSAYGIIAGWPCRCGICTRRSLTPTAR